MNYIEITKAELVVGGNVVRQGDHFTQGYIPRDYKGDKVSLTGKTVTAAIYSKKGVHYEGPATFDATTGVLSVTVRENIGSGTMWVEFTATDPANSTYKQKFPANEFDTKMMVVRGIEDLDFFGASPTTVNKLRGEQLALQQAYEVEVDGKIETFIVESDELKAEFNAAMGALTQDSEVVAARVGYNSLGEKLDDFNTQLAETAEEGLNNLRPTTREKKCVVTFTSDDGATAEFTKLVPLFLEKGVPYTMAIPPNLLTTFNPARVPEMLDLQNNHGFEFVSHTYNHKNLSTITESEIEFELAESKKWLKDRGFKGHDILIYPQGGNTAVSRRIARKYYKVGIGTLPNNGINEDVLRLYDVARVGLGSYFNTDGGLNQDARFPSDGSTLEYYKARVDYALANGQWLIFMMHPWHQNHTETQQQHIRDLIDYIQSLNIPIKTVNDALKEVGNTVDVGDYHYNSSEDYFSVGASGDVKSSKIDQKLENLDVKTNLIEDYSFENLGLQSYSESNSTTIDVTLETAIARTGKRSMKVQRLANSNGYAVYALRNLNRFKGKYVTMGAWVMCPATNVGKMRMGMQDGVSFALSEPVPNDGKWHFAKVTQLISASATALQANIGRVPSNAEAIANDIMYVDSVYAMEGKELSNNVLVKPMYTGNDLAPTDPSTEGSIAYNNNFLFVSPAENSWKRLQLINRTEFVSTNKQTVATPLLDFPAYTITVTPITTAFAIANNFPGGIGGYLWTYRINADHSLNYQVYETVEGVIYRRSYNSSAVPQAWKTPNYQWVNA